MKGTSAGPCHGVIMGDLVGSEKARSVARLHECFNAAIDEQNTRHAAMLASPLTITLGDEFQGLTRSLSAALVIARAMRYRLLSAAMDCRFSLGIVRLKTPLNPDRAWNMMGPGFAPVRDRLNEKKALSLYRFAVEDPVTEALMEALGAGLTAIEQRWTPRQRDDILALLAGESVAGIAGRRGVSVHSVYKVRNSGDFDVYVMQWDALEKALAHLDTLHGMEPC